MVEIIFTILIVGFSAGFLFSMPVAGPISILITSNALLGRYRFCIRAAVGAAVGEIFYVFIAVYGIAMLYSVYRPCIPYFLLMGAVFLLFVGIKISRTRLDLEKLDPSGIITDKLKNKGGLRTGFFLVVTNPCLIIGWLTSSFLVFSFISAIGLKTGGLAMMVSYNMHSISKITDTQLVKSEPLPHAAQPSEKITTQTASSMTKMLLSGIYSVAIAIGVFVWFYSFTRFLIKNRQRLKVHILTRFIQLLGFVLCGIGVYLAVQAITILI